MNPKKSIQKRIEKKLKMEPEEQLMNATTKENKLKELLIKTEENGTNWKSKKTGIQEEHKNQNR